MKERSTTLTHSPFYLLPLWPGACNIIFTEHGLHYSSRKNQKLRFIPKPGYQNAMFWPLRYGRIALRILESTRLTATLDSHTTSPSLNLPFFVSSHLLCNCLFEVHVNQCPFPLSLGVLLVHPFKGLNLYDKRFALHKTLNPSLGLCCLEQEYSSDYFTGYRAGKSVPLLRKLEMPDGLSVLVLNSCLCNVKCLGVSLLSLDGILVHHRLRQVAFTIGQYISTPWIGEILEGSGVVYQNMPQWPKLMLHFGPIDLECQWLIIRPSAPHAYHPSTTPLLSPNIGKSLLTPLNH